MELLQITQKIYYIPNRTNIGVINTEKGIILVDTGLDRETGKKILKLLESHRLKVYGIINTHAHADHCGANAYLKEKTSAIVGAPFKEHILIEIPLFQAFSLFSGVYPPEDLINKFLVAEACKVDFIFEKEIEIGTLKIFPVPLPGHSPNHTGIAVEDVLFTGDTFFSEEVLKKHKIPFAVDIGLQKQSLKFLLKTNYSFYLPSHGNLIKKEELEKVIKLNLERIEEIIEKILKILKKDPQSTEEILKNLTIFYTIRIKNMYQFFLLKGALLSYLKYLKEKNLIWADFKKNKLIWKIK